MTGFVTRRNLSIYDYQLIYTMRQVVVLNLPSNQEFVNNRTINGIDHPSGDQQGVPKPRLQEEAIR